MAEKKPIKIGFDDAFETYLHDPKSRKERVDNAAEAAKAKEAAFSEMAEKVAEGDPEHEPPDEHGG